MGVVMENLEVDVEKYDIQDGQTVLVKVPVGAWSSLEVQDFCKVVMKTFKDEFKRNDKKVNLFIFPISPGGMSPSLEVLDPPAAGSTIVLHVPVGGIGAGDIPKYLKAIKDATMLGWEDKYTGVNLEVFGILDNGSKVEVKVKNA